MYDENNIFHILSTVKIFEKNDETADNHEYFSL